MNSYFIAAAIVSFSTIAFSKFDGRSERPDLRSYSTAPKFNCGNIQEDERKNKKNCDGTNIEASVGRQLSGKISDRIPESDRARTK